MEKIKMSQSLIKILHEYKQGLECGALVKAKYVDGLVTPSTELQELGNYFEYLCTGSLARDGHTPQPTILKNGNLSVGYERMSKQKENFDKIIKHYGFEVLEIDYNFAHDTFSGIADIIALKDGKKCIIDIKTTSLIDDKWTDYGWSIESIEQKDKLHIQAVHYKMLAMKEWGVSDVPFYFFVFSNRNEIDFLIYEVQVDEDAFFRHEQNMINGLKFFNKELVNGFKTYPSVKKCNNCPLKDTCKDFTDIPKIETIYYS
jgi:hypothetical protein